LINRRTEGIDHFCDLGIPPSRTQKRRVHRYVIEAMAGAAIGFDSVDTWCLLQLDRLLSGRRENYQRSEESSTEYAHSADTGSEREPSCPFAMPPSHATVVHHGSGQRTRGIVGRRWHTGFWSQAQPRRIKLLGGVVRWLPGCNRLQRGNSNPAKPRARSALDPPTLCTLMTRERRPKVRLSMASGSPNRAMPSRPHPADWSSSERLR
jgi:hypothetical protein